MTKDERNAGLLEVTFFRGADGNLHGKTPKYMTKEAACADVFSAAEVTIEPFKSAKIPLGIGFQIPKGYCVKLTPRSSQLIKHGLISPLGVIDSDYAGEVSYPVYNGSNEPVTIKEGERVGQVEFCKLLPRPDCWDTCEEERNPEGFGTTGTK